MSNLLKLSIIQAQEINNELSSSSMVDPNNTPKTPEIINSLMAMTNPLDKYDGIGLKNASSTDNVFDGSLSKGRHLQLLGNNTQNADAASSPASLNSQCPSSTIQNICSQLIKEELKVTLQKRQRENSAGNSVGNEQLENTWISGKYEKESNRSSTDNEYYLDTTEEDEYEDIHSNQSSVELTIEDEEKRRKRRERNKVAATKCRLKKKEKTVSLVQESEILENQNYNLKTQIQELEIQRRRLLDMLTIHKTSCNKHHLKEKSVNCSSFSQFLSLAPNHFPNNINTDKEVTTS